MSGRLAIVATPIGNLEDITLRALRTLKEADAILAEDTRRTKILCSHHGVSTRLRSFHAHTPDATVDSLVEELREGKVFALVTDAGTPLVSDPGARLVTAAALADIRVEPIPGASAPLAALSASGLRVSAFRFIGFLPRSGGKRRAAIDAIEVAAEASILFEAPNRLPATLKDLAERMPERPAAVGRELTKLHEEVRRGPLQELAEVFAEAPRGEITVVVEGAPKREAAVDGDALLRQARALLAEGARTKQVARDLAKAHGLPMREMYTLVLRAAEGH